MRIWIIAGTHKGVWGRRTLPADRISLHCHGRTLHGVLGSGLSLGCSG